VEREATPVTSADVFPFAERAVAVADSLLPGEAALVPRCEPHQHEGEQEARDGSGERDVLHKEKCRRLRVCGESLVRVNEERAAPPAAAEAPTRRMHPGRELSVSRWRNRGMRRRWTGKVGGCWIPSASHSSSHHPGSSRSSGLGRERHASTVRRRRWPIAHAIASGRSRFPGAREPALRIRASPATAPLEAGRRVPGRRRRKVRSARMQG
jgi:hypothetical protein